MSDRIIRDELWQSERWLDLPTDTHRLVYISLITRADDYGNLEGGPRRLYRWMHGFTQVKTEDDSVKLMSDLQDVDLARRYEVSGKEYWHLPRFKNQRRYWARKCPKSPHPEEEMPISQRTRKNTTRNPRNASRGVGVGVGVGVSASSTTRPRKRGLGGLIFTPPEWIPAEPWAAWIEARTKARKPPTAYALKLAVRKLENLRDQGQSVHQVLMQSAFNGWSDLYEVKERA